MQTDYFKSKRFLFLWLAALTLNIITFFLIFFKSGLEGNNVALRYNVRAGVLWYGQGTNLYWLAALGIIFNALNFSLFKKLQPEEKFLRTALALSSILLQALLLLSVILLAGVN